MTKYDLPPPKKAGPPETLVVYYASGAELWVPYFDRDAAIAFLEEQEGVTNFKVQEYTAKDE